MSSTSAHDEGHEPDMARPATTVRCDACGVMVTETATDSVPRRYMDLIVHETWCTLCIKSKNETTERTLNIDKTPNAPDY